MNELARSHVKEGSHFLKEVMEHGQWKPFLHTVQDSVDDQQTSVHHRHHLHLVEGEVPALLDLHPCHC